MVHRDRPALSELMTWNTQRPSSPWLIRSHSWLVMSIGTQSLWQGLQAITDYKPAPGDSVACHVIVTATTLCDLNRKHHQHSTIRLCACLLPAWRGTLSTPTKQQVQTSSVVKFWGTVLGSLSHHASSPSPSYLYQRNLLHPASVTLTPIIMKCFERLVMQHIKSFIPLKLDSFQFAYRAKQSTEDPICSALHPALSHLDTDMNDMWECFS